MSSALLSLSRSVQELTEENRALKEDLDRVLSDSPPVVRTKGTFQSHLRRGTRGDRPASLGGRGPPALPATKADVIGHRRVPLSPTALKCAEPNEQLLGAERVVSKSTQMSLVEVTSCQGGREKPTGQVRARC